MSLNLSWTEIFHVSLNKNIPERGSTAGVLGSKLAAAALGSLGGATGIGTGTAAWRGSLRILKKIKCLHR